MIIEDLLDCSLDNFEKLIVDLIVSMGYGSGRKQTETMLKAKKNRPHIVSGVINEDALGLRRIYLEAKQSKDKISNSEINEFIKKVTISDAENGVFITTSKFEDTDIIKDCNIRLVDGLELMNLISEYGT